MNTMSNIVIVSGSHRLDSQSRKVSEHVSKVLREEFAASSCVIDLAEAKIPLWDEGVWEGCSQWQTTWSPIAEALGGSDGVVLVVPEWGGMAPPAIKNFLLLCASEISHKPALIISVSSGEGGTYPVAELRAFGFKNNRICYIPDHVILRHVADVLNGATASGEADARARARVHYSLKVLLAYACALTIVRRSETIAFNTFPYGM
jgi:NAD(P)H-dependent FMN reductase